MSDERFERRSIFLDWILTAAAAFMGASLSVLIGKDSETTLWILFGVSLVVALVVSVVKMARVRSTDHG